MSAEKCQIIFSLPLEIVLSFKQQTKSLDFALQCHKKKILPLYAKSGSQIIIRECGIKKCELVS